MDSSDQVSAFAADLGKVVHRYQSEFDLTLAAAIGALEIVELSLWQEHVNGVDGQDDDFEDDDDGAGESWRGDEGG